MDKAAPVSNDESPFGYPTLMDGYPLEPDEQRAIERVLTDYQRQHAAEAATPADAQRATKANLRPI
ncbi:MAG TPA: hypothetical protein VN193_07595 [Candidatus Angelobacter sp.]|nr:hypothetical protein [Candidatus Angelobacter sp.]